MNMKIPAPIIYQDNTSKITLVTQGGGMAQTKHLRARMNLVRETVQEDRVYIVYVRTYKMLADGLTKPLSGGEFHQFM
jgi:hypothetical protein